MPCQSSSVSLEYHWVQTEIGNSTILLLDCGTEVGSELIILLYVRMPTVMYWWHSADTGHGTGNGTRRDISKVTTVSLRHFVLPGR